MTPDLLYPAAFLIGLTGGVHCFGMCGGIVGALTLGLPPTRDIHCEPACPFCWPITWGGLSAMSSAGTLAGGVGAWAAHLISVHHAQLGLQIIAGLFMILLGLYLAGWLTVLSRLEQAGGALWRRIEPLGRRFFPVRTPLQALGIGLVWGWLPCGLVYSVLVWASAPVGRWRVDSCCSASGWGRCRRCWRWARSRRRWPVLCAVRVCAPQPGRWSSCSGFMRSAWQSKYCFHNGHHSARSRG